MDLTRLPRFVSTFSKSLPPVADFSFSFLAQQSTMKTVELEPGVDLALWVFV